MGSASTLPRAGVQSSGHSQDGMFACFLCGARITSLCLTAAHHKPSNLIATCIPVMSPLMSAVHFPPTYCPYHVFLCIVLYGEFGSESRQVNTNLLIGHSCYLPVCRVCIACILDHCVVSACICEGVARFAKHLGVQKCIFCTLCPARVSSHLSVAREWRGIAAISVETWGL